METLSKQKKLEFLKKKIKEAYVLHAEKTDNPDKLGPLCKE